MTTTAEPSFVVAFFAFAFDDGDNSRANYFLITLPTPAVHT
jgi:hypothetical protein